MNKMIFSLLMLMSTTILWADENKFKSPVRLTESSGKFINDNGKISYPTPVLMDIDNDGQPELVIGDLWGNLCIYEKLDKGDPLSWSGPKKMTLDNGKELKVSNW